ncbi:MAG: uroporphyrinogen-III C-methyltransferase [Legionella sp.]
MPANDFPPEHELLDQTEPPTDAPTVAQTENGRSNKTSKSRRLYYLMVLLLLVSYEIYNTLSQFELRNQIKQIEQTLSSEITVQKQQENDLITRNENSIRQLQASHAQLQKKLSEYHQPVQSTPTKDIKIIDLLALQARCYLELAQLSSYWNKRETTIRLLQQADDLLGSNDPSRFYTIRQEIINEINALKKEANIDLPNILSQLDTVQNAILHLPVKEIANDNNNRIIKKNNPQDSFWQAQLNQSLNLLGKLIVIKKQSNHYQPLIDVSSADLKRERIRLHLQEVQWSALQTNATLYQWLLAQITKEIKLIFQEDDHSTQAVLKQLDNLQKLDLTPTDHLQSKSLELLNKVIDTDNHAADNHITDNGEAQHD